MVTQSAKDVNVKDPNSWILEIRGKEFFLSLIDATKDLAKSHQENFLRKLAQKQGHSEELKDAFKERGLNLEKYLYPCTWTECEGVLGQVLFPYLSFENVVTVQARVNKQASLSALEYGTLVSSQIAALDTFKEGRSERYFHLLQTLLNFFNKHAPQDLKEAFLNHLLQESFSQREIMPLNLGSNLVSFIFDHASDKQIAPFFEREIAPEDGKCPLLFIAFCWQLTEARKDQLFSILLQLGQLDENMLRAVLLTLGEMVHRSTHGYEEYVKINIFQYISQMVHALYVANPDSGFWKEISERQSDSEAYAVLNRALSTIKICQSLSKEMATNKEVAKITGKIFKCLKPFEKDRGLDQIGDGLEYSVNFIHTSTDNPVKQQAQLSILASGFVISIGCCNKKNWVEQLLKTLFKQFEKVQVRTFIIDIIFRNCRVSDEGIDVLINIPMPSKAQQVAFNRAIFNSASNFLLLEPERSCWLMQLALIPDMEEVFEELGVNFKTYFNAQGRPCSWEVLSFFSNCSTFVSEEGLRRDIKKYQGNEWYLQVLWQGVILPDGRHIKPCLNLEKRREFFIAEGITPNDAWTTPLTLQSFMSA